MTDSAHPAPPVARKQPVERRHHGDLFIDDYEWMRDKESPELLAHLAAENAYTEAVTAGQAPLREEIFAEIKGRTQEADLSVPRREGEWWYYSRTVEGGQHPLHCRVRATTSGDERRDWTPPVLADGAPLPGEEVLLDANADSERFPFYAIGGYDVAHDGSLLAWATDTTGDERFALHVRDLGTGELLADEIDGLGYGVEFLPGDRELLYTVVDESWRPHEVRIHRIGDDPARDRVIFREDDPEMWLDATISDDRRFIVITVGNSELSEVHLLPLLSGTGLPLSDRILVLPRRARTLYEVVPVVIGGASKLAILHHDGAPNGELVLVDAGHPALVGSRAERIADLDPEVVIAASERDRLLDVVHAGRHLVVESLRDGLPSVSVRPLDDLATELRPAIADELAAVSSLDQEFGAPVLRLEVDGWLRASRVLEVRLDDLARGVAPTLRRETPVLGGYDPDDYLAERHWATARDGARVPLTVLRHRAVPLDGTAPAIVYGYGSYEITLDPQLSLARASGLDRGAVHVIAHVRGGGELGRAWYEDGKKAKKPNSFTDFVDATAHLVDAGLVDGDRIAAYGGSAGGLLMGAVANLAPERYRAIAAVVPFVDPLTSILDPDLPLSALEWEEWGNPITDPEAYAAIKAYAPYENLRAVDYPAIAAVTSLHDTRVLYVEPAKWVAKLRETTTGDAPIVLKTELDGGHGGASGRYERWRDQAWVEAYLLAAVGATELLPGAGLR